MIKIIAVGKIKEKSLATCIEEYRKRIQGFSKIELIEVNDESIPFNCSSKQEEKIKDIEAERILSKIKDREFVILLDLHGEVYTSEKLAEKIQKIMTYDSSDLVFVIGGSLGLGEAILKRSNMRWKLSDCTFPHQLVRLLVVEQIYRSFTILQHLPYHK